MIIYFSELLLSVLYMIALFYSIFWLVTLLDFEEEPRKRLEKHPIVSVIIPAYNEERNIEKAISSVLKLNYPKNRIEIIVINDGSTDNTYRVVTDLGKKNNIQIIEQTNKGKWAALNNGMRISNGEYIAILDADSTIRSDALKRMLPYFSNEKVAVVLPLLKVDKPKNMLQRIQGYEYLINMFYKKLTGFLDCIHVAPGPFSLYKAEALRKVGGFKAGHKTEDLEIVLRLQRKRHKIIQTVDTEAYTDSPNNLKDLYYQRKRWNLGSILNVWDYRAMIFNREYGDFGLFQLPIIFFAGFLALAIIGITTFLGIIQPLFRALSNLSLVGFDLGTFLRNYSFDFNMLDINYYGLSIAVFVMVMTAIVFVMAHRYAKERIGRYGVFSLLAFVFFYYIWLGIVWLGVTKSLIFRKEGKWQ